MSGKILREKCSAHLVGVIPAAGIARRLGQIPCSKELLPVGGHNRGKEPGSKLKAVSHYLLERFQHANVSKAYIILRKGKWDIPEFYGDGKDLGFPIAYLIMDLPFGVPYTLDQAYLFMKNSTVLFGFPDIIFQPEDAFSQLLKKKAETESAILLGLFPSERPEKADMVQFDKEGRIKGICIKPDSTDLLYAWIIAVWGPDFTEFLHEYVIKSKKALNRIKSHNDMNGVKEIFLGEVIQEWVRKNLKIDYLIFKEGNYIDIGTAEDLVKVTNDNHP